MWNLRRWKSRRDGKRKRPTPEVVGKIGEWRCRGRCPCDIVKYRMRGSSAMSRRRSSTAARTIQYWKNDNRSIVCRMREYRRKCPTIQKQTLTVRTATTEGHLLEERLGTARGSPRGGMEGFKKQSRKRKIACRRGWGRPRSYRASLSTHDTLRWAS